MPPPALIIVPVKFNGEMNSGERMPFLLYRDTRLPVNGPMSWVVAYRRATVAASTLERELRHLALFEIWMATQGLSLADPFDFVARFTPNCIEAVLRPWLAKDFSKRKVVKHSVGANEIKMRLAVIGAYVDWTLRQAQAKLAIRSQSTQILAMSKQRELITRSLRDVTPRKNTTLTEKGLTEQARSDLLSLIDPSNRFNPWTSGSSVIDQAIRHRNQLIVVLMLAFGIRRGDLLKLYTRDALTHAGEPSLAICRRPDDPQDPRMREPNAKTMERLLPLTRFLTRLIDDFIVTWRSKFPNARRSPYLFLSSVDGRPMSSRSINATFESLQDTFPGLHPHACRHTHNNRLRAFCSEQGIHVDIMKKHAKYINGWLGDNMDIYTRIEARRQAQALSKKVQEALFQTPPDRKT